MDEDDNDNDAKTILKRHLITGTPSAPPWYRARGHNPQASYDIMIYFYKKCIFLPQIFPFASVLHNNLTACTQTSLDAAKARDR